MVASPGCRTHVEDRLPLGRHRRASPDPGRIAQAADELALRCQHRCSISADTSCSHHKPTRFHRERAQALRRSRQDAPPPPLVRQDVAERALARHAPRLSALARRGPRLARRASQLQEAIVLGLPPIFWQVPVSLPVEEEAPEPDDDDPSDDDEPMNPRPSATTITLR